MATKFVNGQLVDMSPAEEAAFEAGRVPSLANARADATLRIAQRRAAAESAGVVVQGKPVRTAPTDVARLAILATRPANDPGRPAALALKAVADRIGACEARETELLAAVAAAGDAQTVLAIDIDAGWPA